MVGQYKEGFENVSINSFAEYDKGEINVVTIKNYLSFRSNYLLFFVKSLYCIWLSRMSIKPHPT